MIGLIDITYQLLFALTIIYYQPWLPAGLLWQKPPFLPSLPAEADSSAQTGLGTEALQAQLSESLGMGPAGWSDGAAKYEASASMAPCEGKLAGNWKGAWDAGGQWPNMNQ